MAHEDVRQTILEMIQILEEGGDDNWVAFFRSALAHLDAGDPVSCANRIRSGFGGMGSLNDLCISDRFDELLDEIGAFTSRSIISDRGSITGTAKRLYDQGAALHQACLEKLNSNEATLNVPELIKDLEEAKRLLFEAEYQAKDLGLNDALPLISQKQRAVRLTINRVDPLGAFKTKKARIILNVILLFFGCSLLYLII